MKEAYNISLINLSKKYSDSSNYALKDVSLSIKPGEVYGFLGPNGAGKSTKLPEAEELESSFKAQGGQPGPGFMTGFFHSQSKYITRSV